MLAVIYLKECSCFELFKYIYIYIYIYTLPHKYDATQSQFIKWGLTDLNSEFSFF